MVHRVSFGTSNLHFKVPAVTNGIRNGKKNYEKLSFPKKCQKN